MPPPVCDAPQGTSAEALQLVSADTAFALAFYPPAVAASGAGSNVVLSPYSVSATLTMLDTGAAGETDSQLRAVLHLPGGGASVAPAYAAIACTDETDGETSGDQLFLASSIWAQLGKTFEPAFLSTLAHGYDAPLQQVDFAGGLAGAQTMINAWVSQQTQGQIPALLQAGDIDATSALVLVDAVYFKGTWQTGFDPANTSPQPFFLADGTQVSVPTMNSVVNLAMGSVPGGYVYELSYQGSLAMDFLEPNANVTLATLEASLTPAFLNTALSALGGAQQAELLLPKFSFQTQLQLAPVLSTMGMPDLFSANANLSGMNGMMDLSVGAVVEEAVVEVDESGTVAAAAASLNSCSCGAVAEPPTITIDHPFVFLIRDTNDGSILFMGHVQNPQG